MLIIQESNMAKKTKQKDSAETEPKEKQSIQIVAPEKEVVNPNTKKPYSKEQIELIARTVAKGATRDELALFMIVANKCGLDPFSRQIYFVKRKDKQGNYVGAMQTGIDGYRAIADRSGGYAGSDDAQFDTETEKHPNKATVTVYRIVQRVRVPFTATARWKEFVPPTGQDFMWNKMPFNQLGKCAEALALRKAFPNNLSGIYVEEEMDHVGAVITDAKEVTVQNEQPKAVEGQVMPAQPSEPAKPTAKDVLFQTARQFGAIAGQEAIFIQESLSLDIDWEHLDDKTVANLKTRLMSQLTPHQ